MEQDRETLCQVCLLLYQRGYVVSNDGNVSVRIGEDQVLITPSGVSKGRLTPDMLVVCDLEGRVLAGHLHPSSESAMHLLVYRERPDVGAVVHAHPPAATAFSICRRPLAQHYLTETISGLGEVPVAPFALPSTSQVPDSLRPYVAGCNGACWPTMGPSPGAETSGMPLTGWSRWSRPPRSLPSFTNLEAGWNCHQSR